MPIKHALWPLCVARYQTARNCAHTTRMKMEKADGPKTELVGVSQRMQQSIEEMIASVSRGIGDCMDNARAAQPKSLADDTRSSERRDAVQMVSSTAELLGSIAKLKGEFSHNYNIV